MEVFAWKRAVNSPGDHSGTPTEVYDVHGHLSSLGNVALGGQT